jgi:hypothetical protein
MRSKLQIEDDTACAHNVNTKEHATRINGYTHSLVSITVANNEGLFIIILDARTNGQLLL